MSHSLKIGDLIAKIPVVQGGMGVGVSLSKLAGAVARHGGVGIISTAQIGFREPGYLEKPIETNIKAIKSEIEKARAIADGGIIGVNIMYATQKYEEYVAAAVEAGVDLIITGAGLPMNLPELVAGSKTKIAPIVSSKKAYDVLAKYWKIKYNKTPDMVVIEGPKAGGHLGFSLEEIKHFVGLGKDEPDSNYDDVISEIIESVRQSSETRIPVIVAGGIYDRKDLDHYLALGADGVQIATRFVTTQECDASPEYKNTYINAKKEDIVIVKSPVGMPGRAIRNKFIERVEAGERLISRCKQCVKSCKPAETPYCITDALINAVEGRVNDGLLFCGANAYRAERIETVAQIMEEFA